MDVYCVGVSPLTWLPMNFLTVWKWWSIFVGENVEHWGGTDYRKCCSYGPSYETLMLMSGGGVIDVYCKSNKSIISRGDFDVAASNAARDNLLTTIS